MPSVTRLQISIRIANVAAAFRSHVCSRQPGTGQADDLSWQRRSVREVRAVLSGSGVSYRYREQAGALFEGLNRVGRSGGAGDQGLGSRFDLAAHSLEAYPALANAEGHGARRRFLRMRSSA